MLEHPKWLLFIGTFFGFAVILSVMLDGEVAAPTDSVLYNLKTFDPRAILQLLSWDYAFLAGNWGYLRWALAGMNYTFGALVLRDITRTIRGV
jgi:hypothetical protein